MKTQELKISPKPTRFSQVIVLKFDGPPGRTVRQDFGLRQQDQQPRSEFETFKAAHQKVRAAMGYHPQWPEDRYVFPQFEIRDEAACKRPENEQEKQKQKGVPNGNLGSLMTELFERGYFLIDANAYYDDRDREVVRITFSCKDEDRKIEKATPSQAALTEYFKSRTYKYIHAWDRRWVRVDTGEEMGNLNIAICGGEMRPQDCMTYRVMHLGAIGAEKGEADLMSFDVARHPESVAPAKKLPASTTSASMPTAPTLKVPLGARIKIPMPKAKAAPATTGPAPSIVIPRSNAVISSASFVSKR